MNDLYDFVSPAVPIPGGLELVAALSGFSDAGMTASQLREIIFNTLDYQEVASFHNDELYDYRARRPIAYFDRDHISDFEPPELKLYLVRDELGHSFLFLSGYEPDFKWEAFTEALLELIERFEVKTVTWVNAIPIPVPHTRPIGVTVSGNRRNVTEAISIWKPSTQVPSNVLHLLEYQLSMLDYPVSGLVILVPHYLAENEYPAAAVAAAEAITLATNIILPTQDLKINGLGFNERLKEQLESNSELVNLVETLEQRHDQYLSSTDLPGNRSGLPEDLPSAEELAAELERYLSERQQSEEP